MPDNIQALRKFSLPGWARRFIPDPIEGVIEGAVNLVGGGGSAPPRIDTPSGGGGGYAAPGGVQATPAIFGEDMDGSWDWNPFADEDDLPTGGNGLDCNIQVMVPPMKQVRNRAPRGYVIVDYRGQKVAMLKEVARKCGLWKPRAKPLFTASEAKTIRKAARLQKKGDRLAKMLNQTGGCAPLRRTRGKR